MTNPVRVDTPESVEIRLEVAGFGSRFFAALIDGLIQGVGTVLLLVLAMGTILPDLDLEEGFSPDLSATVVMTWLAILAVGGSLLFVLYKPLLEAFWNGQTVGKRVAGIRVVREDGMPAGLMSIIIRNLLRVVDFLPFNYAIGSIALAVTQKNQRLGDLTAGTIVIRDRPASLPAMPTAPPAADWCDPELLRERALRLSEADLNPARGYWERRGQLDPASRLGVAHTVAWALAARMEWEGPLPPDPAQFIEAVLYARSR